MLENRKYNFLKSQMNKFRKVICLLNNFLKSDYGLDIQSFKIHKIKETRQLDDDQECVTYIFKYSIFVKKLKSKADKQISEIIEDFLKSKKFELINLKVEFIENEQYECGIYLILYFKIHFDIIKKVKNLKLKFKFISKK